MNLEQFEKKVAEFALEAGWVPNEPDDNTEHSYFFVTACGHYKRKSVKFWTECENKDIHIEVFGSNYSDLFDEVYRMIKSTVKHTRTRKEEE